MGEKTKVLSVHRLRRVARNRERHVQRALRVRLLGGELSATAAVALADVPSWATGVRVEKAGLFQHAVVATSHRGH